MTATARCWCWRAARTFLVLSALVSAASCGRTDFDTGPAAGVGGAGVPSGIPQLPPTPGLFICGSALCRTATQQCCVGLSAAGQLSASCTPLAATCAGVSLQCDEPADCAGGAASACCVGLGGGTGSLPSIGSQCVAPTACAGLGRLVVCRQDADCPAGTTCCASGGLPTCLASCPKI